MSKLKIVMRSESGLKISRMIQGVPTIGECDILIRQLTERRDRLADLAIAAADNLVMEQAFNERKPKNTEG